MSFNTGYAKTRLQGVVNMLEDAASLEEVENAIIHLMTVYEETIKAAKESEIVR